MKLPIELKATDIEQVKLMPIRWFRNIPKATPTFKKWKGELVADTYGNKTVLDFYGSPEFAELGILRMMERAGWSGVWVDAYRNAFRTKFWPKDVVELNATQKKLLDRIREKAGTESGCFDVFCWMGKDFIFIEAKRHKKDRIRPTQQRWLQAAIRGCRIPLYRFLIIEWSLSE
jgi:hypothetical protein